MLSILRNKWMIIAVASLCVALFGAFAAGFYYYQYEDLRSRISGVVAYVNVGIDYGDFARVWYNHTDMLSGSTIFDVTKHIANVNYTIAAGLGTYVSAINGVGEKPGGYGWTFWMWNSTSKSWFYPGGVDKYVLIGNEIIMWYYTSYGNLPP